MIQKFGKRNPPEGATREQRQKYEERNHFAVAHDTAAGVSNAIEEKIGSTWGADSPVDHTPLLEAQIKALEARYAVIELDAIISGFEHNLRHAEYVSAVRCEEEAIAARAAELNWEPSWGALAKECRVTCPKCNLARAKVASLAAYSSTARAYIPEKESEVMTRREVQSLRSRMQGEKERAERARNPKVTEPLPHSWQPDRSVATRISEGIKSMFGGRASDAIAQQQEQAMAEGRPTRQRVRPLFPEQTKRAMPRSAAPQ